MNKHLRWSVPALAGLIALGAFLFRGDANSAAEGRPRVEAPQQAAHRSQPLAEPESLAKSKRTAAPGRDGLKTPTPTPDCEFFGAWNERPLSSEVVTAFLEMVGPLVEVDLQCVPAEWLLLASILRCRGEIRLAGEDLELIAEELAFRMPSPDEMWREPFSSSLTPESLECLIASLTSPQASGQVIGAAWAWWLMATFGAEGDFMAGDPEVVAALIKLMDNWPIHEDAWWSNLAAGIFNGPGRGESYGLPVALFEAMHQVLPREEWLHHLATFAESNDRADGISGAFTFGMARSLGKYLSGEEFAGLLMSADSGNDLWRRTLLLGIPNEMRWPAAGHQKLPLEALLEFIRLRDSTDFAFRYDILEKQWELFGPQEATINMRDFVYSADSSIPEWDWLAALHVNGAVVALQVETHPGDDAPYLQEARELLQDLFALSSPQASRSILVALRDRWWKTASYHKADRQMVVDVLGPAGMETLDADIRSWLQSP